MQLLVFASGSIRLLCTLRSVSIFNKSARLLYHNPSVNCNFIAHCLNLKSDRLSSTTQNLSTTVLTSLRNCSSPTHFLKLKSVTTAAFQVSIETMADNRYCIEYAKTGRSGCKKCKTQIDKGVPRIGKITPNPFSDDGGEMKVWYHTRCMFETLKVRVGGAENGTVYIKIRSSLGRGRQGGPP